MSCQSQLIKISSFDRDLKQSESTSNFIVPIRYGKRLEKVKGVVVKSISVANTFDNINQYNNKFRFWSQLLDNIQLGVTDRLVIESIPRDPLFLPETTDVTIPAQHYDTIEDIRSAVATALGNDFNVTLYQNRLRIERPDTDYTLLIDGVLSTSKDILGFVDEKSLGPSQIITGSDQPEVDKLDDSFENKNGVEHNVEVPVGYYELAEFTAELEDQINASDYAPESVAITLEPNNHIKMTFTSEVSFYGSMLERKGDPTGLSHIMGFLDGKIQDHSTTFIAKGLPSLTGPLQIAIHSRQLAPNNSLDASGVSNNMMIMIPLNEVYGATETYISSSARSDLILYKTPRNIDEIDIRLRDCAYGRPLNSYQGEVTILLNLIF